MEKKAGVYFRIIHRYLGFYLVGIMAVYSVSGITLIFRRTDTFKKVTEVKTQLTPNLNENDLGKNLKIRINAKPTNAILKELTTNASSADKFKKLRVSNKITKNIAPKKAPLLFPIPPIISAVQTKNVTLGVNCVGTIKVFNHTYKAPDKPARHPVNT